MSTVLDTITFEDAVRFVSMEADCLDHCEYQEWLGLWADDGLYAIPINSDSANMADELNYAYDDAAMRRMRVARLSSGESMSACDAARTLRSLSRFRQLEGVAEGEFQLRCAQHLVEYKRGNFRTYAANVSYTLRVEDGALRLVEKTVRLINSTDALAGMSFLL